MTSELNHGRRRTNSTVSSSQRHGSQTAKQLNEAVQPKSTHTSDEFLQDFLSPSFDPASFLNAKLPPLAQKSASSQGATGAVPVAELAALAQSLLSQINAQTTRLSDASTQLTDDILRSGSRLAYEVELLRGETLGLTEMMNEKLLEDVKVFVPGGLQQENGARNESGSLSNGPSREQDEAAETPDGGAGEPLYIKQLQTLTLVRARLESVIKTFGDAMDFVFPPSEVSVSSSFLSVSAPEPGSQQQSSEEKGQQVLRERREEISTLLTKTEDPVQGIEKAALRIEELKELNRVWKGTAEEKGRNRFIESLAKMVEDRHRDLIREMEQAGRREGRTETGRSGRGGVGRDAAGEDGAKAPPGGFGLISQLQKLRSGL